MKYIELFAGCGGLSLGLKGAGGELVFANELSPMAAETYAYNFFSEDWAEGNGCKSGVWLGSNFGRSNFLRRLRENPLEVSYPSANCEVQDAKMLVGKVVVGSIKHLNNLLNDSENLRSSFVREFGNGQVDLISGGPPCQSFSMAGMRQLQNERNTLPWEFAKFVGTVKPKMAMLENVQGILNAFIQNGEKFHAWFEVCKAFAEVGYVPLCFLVNARFVGVAQNRPRFIMLALSRPLATSPALLADETMARVLEPSLRFFDKFHRHESTRVEDLPVFDTSNASTRVALMNSPFSSLFEGKTWTVKDAIDDIADLDEPSCNPTWSQGAYSKMLSKHFGRLLPKREISNLEMRANSPRVKQRFRVYQLIEKVDKPVGNLIRGLLKGESPDIDDEIGTQLLEHEYLDADGKSFIRFSTLSELAKYLESLKTKKQTQRALVSELPAPAALSIPDDACHYRKLRTLSVREMARIQSFPDNFVFRSKVTTGGTSRRFEVPQYTQIGNAVPPLLGLTLGRICNHILKMSNADVHVADSTQAA